ncbi:MAG TPA: putative toxin-antitoxin system toxin component, PIN family [Candidatus Nanoarchaeia archaeon]|nr:putative toxin-antitoxin system toxin component, PIN family [Candidatus Nanoarchaeia archaeon]
MKRVTLDSNVWLSGLIWKSEAAKILALAEKKEIALFCSKEILFEIAEVLNRERKFAIKNQDAAKEAIEKIIRLSSDTQIIIRTGIIHEDPNDNKIIDCAVNSKSEYLITYDKHLLKLQKYKRIKILHPTEFIKDSHF